VAPATPRSPPTRGASAGTASPAISGKTTNQSRRRQAAGSHWPGFLYVQKAAVIGKLEYIRIKSMYRTVSCLVVMLNLLTFGSSYTHAKELFFITLNC
jgi:hypothetical protein